MIDSSNLPALAIGVTATDEAVRRRLEHILRAGGLSITAARTPESLGDLTALEVLVMAGRLFSPESPSLVRLVRSQLAPDIGVVACTERVGPREFRRAIDEGLDGLVWDRLAETALLPTVLAVAAGQLVVPRELRRRLERPNLSVREKQVLSLVIMGLSNGEIAGKLYIGEATVKTHLSSSFRKLGVSSRSEAAHVITDPEEGLGTGILSITDGADSAPS